MVLWLEEMDEDLKYTMINSSLLENLVLNRRRWQPVFAIVLDEEGASMTKFDNSWFNPENKEMVITLLEFWTEMLKKGMDKPMLRNVH